ncbi:unnamed protein product [Calypogeia fissa]
MPRPSRKAQSKYGFFNLPSDEALGYPRFSSFEQREAYIRKNIPKKVLDCFSQIVAADHENQATQTLGQISEVDEYSNMEHSQRFLDDTKRFKVLMEAATKQYQDEQDFGSTIHVDHPLPKGPQEQDEEQERKTSETLNSGIVNIVEGDVNIIDNDAHQVPTSLTSIKMDPLNHKFPNHNPSASSKGQELKTNEVDQQDKGCSSSTRASPLRGKNSLNTTPCKRKNKYLDHSTNENTFQQLPLKSLMRPKKKLKISKSPVMELRDHVKLFQTVFVGETTSHFSPLRGDLIIVHPEKGTKFMSKGYLTSYEGPETHKFEHGELVVRIGCYEQVEERKYLHQPYQNLELYAYNREGDWRYLGRECEMTDTDQIPIDASPGKHLQVGSAITLSPELNFITPRRGDIIIRRATWIENFAHRENFRRSVVKWHKERPVQWEPEDMLIRLFVDKETDCKTKPFVYSKPIPSPDPGDHSDCTPHGPCEEVHTPLAPGFAELYRIEGLESRDMGWVFWGRTKHIYDTPYLKIDPLYLHLYNCDEDN